MEKPMTYKGYSAKIELSGEDDCLIGHVPGIRPPITFQGDSVKEIRQAFEKAVDSYLDGCAERNEEPQKPASDQKVVRVSPALHGILAMVARQENKSVGTWLAEVCKGKSDKKD